MKIEKKDSLEKSNMGFITVKFINSSYEFDSRDKREVQVLKNLSSNVYVLDYRSETSFTVDDNVTIISRTKNYSKYSIIRKLQIILRIFIKDPKFIRKFQPNLISCHDLTALFIGWISTLMISKTNKPKLVYDSHEFELGRNTNRPRSRLKYTIVKKLENFLIKKSIFSIMVNDSIADEVVKIHHLSHRPIVVRNIPNYWYLNMETTKKVRQDLMKKIENGSNIFLMMYHGAVMPGRGIEKLIDVLRYDTSIGLVVLGNSENEYIEKLVLQANNLNVRSRLIFHQAVDYKQLCHYVSAADVGMITIPALTKSYYYMLPNKFFECIQALTPVICSDFPEVSKITNQYKIGICTNPNDPQKIYESVKKMKNNKEEYLIYKANLVKAKNELCWEKEVEVLRQAYKNAMR